MGLLEYCHRLRQEQLELKSYQSVSHRGPDDLGESERRFGNQGGRVMFGHRRLSILDYTSAGRQPMAAAITTLGGFTILFGGAGMKGGLQLRLH